MSRESRDRSLRELMDGHGVGALLLSSPANFAWYTGGADNKVDHGDHVGVASVLVTMDDAYVLTNNIEAPRMREEQTPEMEVVEHPWHEEPAALLKELTGVAGMGTDFPSEFGHDLSAEISPLRYVLDGDAIEDYRRLGADTAHAVSEAAAPYPRRWTSSRLLRSFRRRASGAACSSPSSLPPLRSGSYATGIRSRTASLWEDRPCSSPAPSAAASSRALRA